MKIVFVAPGIFSAHYLYSVLTSCWRYHMYWHPTMYIVCSLAKDPFNFLSLLLDMSRLLLIL